jgi:hypothetical protein
MFFSMQVHRQAHTGHGALLPPFPGQEEEDGESTFQESLHTSEDSLRHGEDSLRPGEDSLRPGEDSLAIQEDSDDAQEDRLMIQEDSNGIPEAGIAIPNGKGAAETGLRGQEDILLLTHHNGGREEMERVKKGEIRVRSMLKMQQDMEEEEGMDVDMTKQDINSDRSVVFVKNCWRLTDDRDF